MYRLKRIIACVILLTSICSITTAQIDQIDEQLFIDFTNLDNGTIAVSVLDPEPSARYKLNIQLGEINYLYGLDTSVATVVPLQMGNGEYSIELYKHLRGTQYQLLRFFRVTVEIDRRKVWLQSNVKVDFSSPEKLLSVLSEIVSPTDSDMGKLDKITRYMRNNYKYDWITAAKRYDIPEYADLDRVLERKMGICEELAALTVALLRLEGVPARMVIGTANGIQHAWVQALVDGKVYRFDPSVDKYTQAKRTYIAQRYY